MAVRFPLLSMESYVYNGEFVMDDGRTMFVVDGRLIAVRHAAGWLVSEPGWQVYGSTEPGLPARIAASDGDNYRVWWQCTPPPEQS